VLRGKRRCRPTKTLTWTIRLERSPAFGLRRRGGGVVAALAGKQGVRLGLTITHLDETKAVTSRTPSPQSKTLRE
jgi:hypothetical protein